MNLGGRWVWMLGLGMGLAEVPLEASFQWQEREEKKWELKSEGPLEITNAQGGVVLQGEVSQSGVRVQAERTASGKTYAEAQARMQQVGLRGEFQNERLEVATQYRSGQSLAELLHRDRKGVQQDLKVVAPGYLKARLWGGGVGKIKVKDWSGPLEVRSQGASIRIKRFRGESLKVDCLTCSIFLQDVETESLRLAIRSGSLHLKEVHADSLWVEGEKLKLKGEKVSVEAQIYEVGEGSFSWKDLEGEVQIEVSRGDVLLEDFQGQLTGRLGEGSWKSIFSHWERNHSLDLNTESASVELILGPQVLLSPLELESKTGKIKVNPLSQGVLFRKQIQFGLKKAPPSPSSHWRGEIGIHDLFSFFRFLQYQLLASQGIHIQTYSGSISVKEGGADWASK